MSIYCKKDRVPFTYLIGWSSLNIWYYGSRYSKGCHPTDLWTKYFTSSLHVKRFVEKNGDPDVLMIRRVFNTATEAKAWENRVLRKLWVHRQHWLNKRFYENHFVPTTESIQKRLQHPNTIKARKMRSLKQRGSQNHMFGRVGALHHLYGKPRSAETKARISQNHKDMKGSNNTNAKTIILVNPNGETIRCYGNFKATCESMGLPYSTMNRILKKRIWPSFGPCVGYDAYVDAS
jgi:hypothetical protein